MHPKAYTVEEIDGVWHFYHKDGEARNAKLWYRNSKEGAEELAAQAKEWDDFSDWYKIAGNLSDETFAKGARKFNTIIRQKEYLQNWLRDELLMRLILKNNV